MKVDLRLRANQLELMDSGDIGPEKMARALGFLAYTNRFFGGRRVLLQYFRRWSRRWQPGATLSILDVGTGGADLPLALMSWSRARNISLRITAIDSTPEAAQIAASVSRVCPEIRVIDSDLKTFLRRGQRFDYIMGSLLLHHLPMQELPEAISLCDEYADRGLLFSDLVRSYPAYWSVKALTAAFGDEVTRFDGPLSVRRGFRPEELKAAAAAAGVGYLSVRRHPFFRLSLAGEKK